MNKRLNSKQGITLIALVITIIILLILAAISIGALTGESGLFSKTKDAVNMSNIAQEKENNTLKEYANEIDKYLKELEEDENISFFVNGEKFTCKKGTTWYKYLTDTYPNPSVWFNINASSAEEVLGLCMYVWDEYNEVEESDDTLYTSCSGIAPGAWIGIEGR